MENISEEKITKFISGAGLGLAGTVGGRILGLIGNIFAARVLGPVVFGLYAIGWTLVRFLSLMAPLGLDKGIIRFTPKYFGKDDAAHKGLVLQALVISLISGLSFGILLYIFAEILATEIYHNYDLVIVFRSFSFAIPPIVLTTVIAATTRSTQRVGYSILIQNLGQPLLGLIMMIAFYFLGFELIGMVLSDILSFIIVVFIGMFILTRLYPKVFNRKTESVFSWNEMIAFSFPASLASAFVIYIFWVDRLLVGYFRTPFEIGIYQVSSQISTLFSVILAGINLIVIPMFANAFHRNDIDTLKYIYIIATKWGIYLSLPVIIVFFVSPKEVLFFLYGDQYSGGASVLIILLLGQLINLFTGAVAPLIVMSGNQNILFKLSGITLFIDIVMNAILIPKYGLFGAAISTTFSLGSLFIVALVWVRNELELWPYDRRYLKGFAAAILSLFAVILVKGVLTQIGLDLLLQGIVAVTVFGFSLVVQKLDKEDKTFLVYIWKKVAGKL